MFKKAMKTQLENKINSLNENALISKGGSYDMVVSNRRNIKDRVVFKVKYFNYDFKILGFKNMILPDNAKTKVTK